METSDSSIQTPNIDPPKWADRFLEWYCAPNLLEEVQGDVWEIFEITLQEKGKAKANRVFIWLVFKFFNYSTIKGDRKLFHNQKPDSMLNLSYINNYIKTAIRSLLKKKTHSFINIFGLAIGMAFSLLITIYVIDEFQVNSQIRNLDQQFFIESEWKEENLGIPFTTLAPMGKTLAEKYHHLVANYHRIHAVTTNVSSEDDSFRENLEIGDSTMLTMFGLPLSYGDEKTALNDPSSIVISEELALKFFGKANVIGQTLTLETSNPDLNPLGTKDFQITGVLSNSPPNSITDYFGTRNPMFVSIENIQLFGGNDDDWGNYIILTRIELQKDATVWEVEEAMNQLVQEYAPENIQANLTPQLEPLKHYNLNAKDGEVKKLITTLSAIALFILLMAIINFVNISIGRAGERLREIGVRKVLGSHKSHLVIQFMTESIVITLFAFVFALGLAYFTLPYFNELIGKSLFFDALPLLPTLATFGIIALGTGILAGIYPAIVLSRFEPIRSLKGKIVVNKKGVWFKRSLLLVQFSIAIFLLVSANVITSQVDFLLDADLGYNEQDVLVISSVPRDYSAKGVEKLQTLKNEFLAIKGVENAALSYEIPDGRFGRQVELQNSESVNDAFQPFQFLLTDEDYLKTYELNLLDGKFFVEEGQAPKPLEVVINETAAKLLNLDSPVGKQLKIRNSDQTFIIVGLIEDFHFGSLHSQIPPLVMANLIQIPSYRYFSFRLKEDFQRETQAEIERIWKQNFPDKPYISFLMEDKVSSLYQKELQLKNAAYLAMILGAIIVTIGVFGLILQNIHQRFKEIGIRKVLGASIIHIIELLGKEFILLVVMAFVLISPITYYFLDLWLQDFAFQVKQTLFPYLIGIIMILFITVLTIGFQSTRAVISNPIEVLKED